MNYISEINRFYDWLETNQIPKSAIALWHGLMHIANKTGWQEKFTVAISTIESKTGFKKSELTEARNILTQKGRIIWKPRGGNLSAEYEIISFCVHNTDAINYTKSYTSADTIPVANPPQKQPITKLKETKLNDNSSGANAPVKKSHEETTAHWKKLVDTWFIFYESVFNAKPSFFGADAKNFKSIISRLEKLSKNVVPPVEWTEDYAARCLIHFLKKAYDDPWLKGNFLIANLNTKFDVIVNQNGSSKIKSNGTADSVGALLSGDKW